MKPVRNILFIKLCCIGDILFLTPAIRSIREKYPEAVITVLASTWIKEIVERIPSVDAIEYYDSPYKKVSMIHKLSETLSLLKTLRGKKFDSAVIGHRSSFFSILAAAAGIPRRIGFQGAALLTDTVHFDDTTHETARYLRLTECLTGRTSNGGMELSAAPSDVSFAERYLMEKGMDSRIKLIGVFPGGGDNPGTRMHIKRWERKRYAELLKKLFGEHSLAPVFIGGATDKTVVSDIIQLIDGAVPYVDTTGEITLGELNGILSKCTLVLGGDSGPVHMAAALGIPTVSLFGPSDPRLVAPIGPLHRHLWKQVHCSPCYTPRSVQDKKYFRGDEFICITGTLACMDELSVEEVFHCITELLRIIPQHGERL